jgi:hypothetical protein
MCLKLKYGSGLVGPALADLFSYWQVALGEGLGRFDEEVGFRVSSGGTYVPGASAPGVDAVTRCLSSLLMHLSLSLSLFALAVSG